MAPGRFWAGSWKDVHKRPIGARVCAELVKVQAHTAARHGERPEERLARLANEWADSEAKAGVALQPTPLPLVKRLQAGVWADATTACRVLAEATLLWPAALGIVSQRRRPTSRVEREEVAQRRREATSERQAVRRRALLAALSSHQWVQVGSQRRCAVCLAVHGLPAARAEVCPGYPDAFSIWLDVARSGGHSMKLGVLHEREAALHAVPVAWCSSCGSWMTTATQGSRCRLLDACRCRRGLDPTKAGREARSRAARGLHPKPGHGPPVLTHCRWPDAVNCWHEHRMR